MELPFPEIEEVVGRADSACMVGEKCTGCKVTKSQRCLSKVGEDGIGLKTFNEEHSTNFSGTYYIIRAFKGILTLFL